MAPFLHLYLLAVRAAPYVAGRHLQRRLAWGKEDPERWREKLGEPSAARPDGKLIWLNAVGLGEVLSLRGLIREMAAETDAHFLVTSTTRISAEVFAKNLPDRTMHQFLPLDAPQYRRAFLDHWQPDLCLWAEQEIWPGFVCDLAARDIPQAMVAVRMTEARFRKNRPVRQVFDYLYAQMEHISAQDQATAKRLTDLGAEGVTISGSLKPTADPLAVNADDQAALEATVAGRRVWLCAPAHPADAEVAFAAHRQLLDTDPSALLILVPRHADLDIAPPFPFAKRSTGALPQPDQSLYIADTYGELGLLYRCADAVLIGGTYDETEGHSPWEAVALETAVFHGPRTANFATDYKALGQAGGAVEIASPAALAEALRGDLSPMIAGATATIDAHKAGVKALARTLVGLL